MTQRCDKCGTELFTGQQFCRLCGTPTRAFTSGEIPTQILPDAGAARAGQTAHQPAETTPLPPRDTADPYPSRYAGRQPSAPQTASHSGGPRRSRRGLVFGLLAAVVVSVGASVYIARQVTLHWIGKKATQRQIKIVVPPGKAPERPEPPPMPGVAEAPEPPELELEDVLDEAGAEVSGDKTIITKTFPLDPDGSFTLGHLAGDITVEGWDGEAAEVRITKRGGTSARRAEVEIRHAHADDELQLETAGGGGAANGVRDVQYAIRLPRRLRRIEISARDANVRLTGLRGNIAVNLMRGNIDLDGVSGTVSTRTTKGHTKITLADDTPAEPQVFNGVNGDIELRLKPGTNADLKAETIDGRVEADDDLGLRIDRRLAGEQAVGRLGAGGHPIVVKTVSGNIRIRN